MEQPILPKNYELFLKFNVQKTIEKADFLFNKIAPEEKPYDYKY